MFKRLRNCDGSVLINRARTMARLVFLLMLTLSVPAQAVQSQDPCTVKKQYDDAQSKTKKTKDELDALQKGGNAKTKLPATDTELQQELIKAKADRDAEKASFDEAEKELKAAEKEKNDFDNAADKGKKIAVLKGQLAEHQTKINEAEKKVEAKKNLEKQLTAAEEAVKKIEVNLRRQMPEIAFDDVDAAKAELEGQVAKIEQLVKEIKKNSINIADLVNGKAAGKVDARAGVSLQEIKLRCPDIAAILNRINVKQRSVLALLDTWEKEQDPNQRGSYKDKIKEYENGIEIEEGLLIPAGQSCKESLLISLDELSQKRSERDKIDPDGSIANAKKQVNELKNDKSVERALKNLETEQKTLNNRLPGLVSYKNERQTAKDNRENHVREIEKAIELSAAGETVEKNFKPPYDAVVGLKDVELQLANDAISEAQQLINNLGRQNVSRSAFKQQVADFKKRVADWKSKAEKWKTTQDLSTKTELVAEKKALLDEKKRLKEINEGCEKKAATAEHLRKIRLSLDSYKCFSDVSNAINTINNLINNVLALTVFPAENSPRTPLLASIGSVPSGTARQLFSGAAAIRVSFANSFAASSAQLSTEQDPLSKPVTRCPKLEDLEMNFEDIDNYDALNKQIEKLKTKIIALNQDKAAVNVDLYKAAVQLEVAKEAERDARIKLANLRETGKQETDKRKKVCAFIKQNKPANLKTEIETLAAQAEAKQADSGRLLDQARSLAANCASVDAQSVRDRYNQIKSLSQEIAQEKTAADQKRTALEQARATVNTLLDGGFKDLDVKLDAEQTKAANAALEYLTIISVASATQRRLLDARTQIRSEINALNQAVPAPIPPDIQNRFIELHGLLTQATEVPVIKKTDLETDNIRIQVNQYKREADAILLEMKNASSGCDTTIPSADAAMERMTKASSRTDIDPNGAAQALREAQVCEASRKCIPVIDQARQLIEQLKIEEGVSAINQARAQGCNVAGLENTLDYYRTIRDAAAALFNARQQCNFQGGLDFAQRMPQSIQNNPWISNGVQELRAGLSTQQQVEQFITQATNTSSRASTMSLRNEWAESRKLFAEADGYVAQADQLAKAYPCLVGRVNKYREEYNRLKQSVNNGSDGHRSPNGTTTDEVPAVLGTGKSSQPTDEVPTVLGRTGVVGAPIPPRRPPDPTDSVPAALGTGKGRENPTDNVPGSLGSGKSKTDDGAVASAGGQQSGGTAEQQQTPKKPGKVETVGKVIGAILGGLNKPTGNTGSTGANTGSTSTGTTNTGSTGKPSAERWQLVAVTPLPDKPIPNSGYSYGGGSSVQLKWNAPPYQINFQWTPPPQTIDANGFTVTVTVAVTPPPQQDLSALGCAVPISGLENLSPKAPICADPQALKGAGASKQVSVTMKPIPGSSELEVRIDLMWRAVMYKYTYRRVQ